MPWNPEQYLKFAGPRLRPAVDLLARVDVEEPERVFDLGCGAGNVTHLLLQRWPRAAVTGVDDSAEMLAQAAGTLPEVNWVNQSIATWRADSAADVIFSNAALHWLPDHDRLFRSLLGSLASGGVLAVQMPNNFSAPSHTAVTESILSGPWRSHLEWMVRPAPVMPPAFYWSVLSPLAESLDIWETEYLQVLEGTDPVKEWTKGTWLRQFLDALPAAERPSFEEDYARRLRIAYPARPDGKTLFPFRRLFILLKKR